MMHKTEIKSGSVAAAPLSVTGPQPAWLTLNEARERAFTGEIVFEVDPEVLAYLDNGVVYYAERSSDTSLGRRLLESGLVDVAQLDRGTVKVGDVEHLGRLFDREPSVDRDAVIVMLSTATEELIADIANSAVTSVRVTAYRHHVSGVHRWFVAPFEPVRVSQSLSTVPQLGPRAVDDEMLLPFDGIDPEELTIDWIDPIEGVDNVLAFDEFDVAMFEAAVDAGTVDSTEQETDAPAALDNDAVDLSFELAEFVDVLDDEVLVDTPVDDIQVEDAQVDDIQVEDPQVDDPQVDDPQVDDAIQTDVVTGDEPVGESLVTDEPVELDEPIEVIEMLELTETIEWTPVDEVPTTGEAVADPSYIDERAVEVADWPEPTAPVDIDTDIVDVVEVADVSDVVEVEPSGDLAEVADSTPELASDGEPQFVLPPLDLVDEPSPAQVVENDDVAEAVRRAISAIESATIESAGTSPDGDGSGHQPDNALPPAPVATPAHSGLAGGFAPPTLETRAEALYERRAAAAAAVADQSDELAVAGDGGDTGERRSALRRLIGSLRRKDS